MLNLTGKVYGKLKLLEPVTINDNSTRVRRGYNCLCECGNTKQISTERLRSKTASVKSCGSCPRYKLSPLFKIAAFLYERNAKKRNLKFLLSENELKNLFAGNCHYCGEINSNCVRVRYHDRKFYYNGIDRLDSTKDYTTDNCVSCCKDCNYRKGNSSYDEFINWIKKLHLYNNL